MTWRTQRVPNESDPNFGTMRAIRTIKGPDGKAHAAWDEGSTWYKQASDEQKAWGANTITDFNKQFDPTNAVNPANDKLYKLQAMKPELRDRIMANAGQNTPAAKAMMAQWGDAISQYKAQSQPPPGPTQPPPGPTQPPPASVQGQPQQPGQPPPANMGDARFHNGNPYYNGKGNLRMPFRNAIASQMMNDMQSQQQPATSWNMGGQNGQAMFGTQNQYSYWPQGGQQGYGMGAPSSNPYQQSYGPPQTMNYYGGQQGYGGGGQYGEPPMPSYGSGTSGGKPYQGPPQSYGGGRGYGEPPMPNYSQNSGGQENYDGELRMTGAMMPETPQSRAAQEAWRQSHGDPYSGTYQMPDAERERLLRGMHGPSAQRDDGMRLRQADPRWQAAQNRSRKPVWLLEGGQGESYESFKNREAQVKAQNPEQWATWEREDALAAARPTRPPPADGYDLTGRRRPPPGMAGEQ